MPCPLFVPVFHPGSTPHGDIYRGNCAADPLTSVSQVMLSQCCNPGYARGTCERAAECDADATSFMLKKIGNGEMEIAWAMERDHHPVAVGTARIGPSSPIGNRPLDRQLEAYAESCLWSKR